MVFVTDDYTLMSVKVSDIVAMNDKDDNIIRFMTVDDSRSMRMVI